MATPLSRRQTLLYVVVVGALSMATIRLLYGVYSAGLVTGIESFLADPSGTVQENPAGLLAIAGTFFSLFALVGVVVLAGARHLDGPARQR